jgi:DNA-directed RNA polymerase subunit omega
MRELATGKLKIGQNMMDEDRFLQDYQRQRQAQLQAQLNAERERERD